MWYFLPPPPPPDNWPPDSNLYLYVFEQQHLIKCSGFIVKINLNNIYFLPRTIDPFQTSVFDQTYLLTPRLLQTSYVNALILESRSIIIYSFNLKSYEKFWKLDFFRNFRTSELSQTTPSPRPGMSESIKVLSGGGVIIKNIFLISWLGLSYFSHIDVILCTADWYTILC